MKGCDDYSATIQLYLDRELSDQDLEDFRAHLEECEACRAEFEAAEKLSALLHRSGPLYSAPDALRADCRAVLFDPRPWACQKKVSRRFWRHPCRPSVALLSVGVRWLPQFFSLPQTTAGPKNS